MLALAGALSAVERNWTSDGSSAVPIRNGQWRIHELRAKFTTYSEVNADCS